MLPRWHDVRARLTFTAIPHATCLRCCGGTAQALTGTHLVQRIACAQGQKKIDCAKVHGHALTLCLWTCQRAVSFWVQNFTRSNKQLHFANGNFLLLAAATACPPTESTRMFARRRQGRLNRHALPLPPFRPQRTAPLTPPDHPTSLLLSSLLHTCHQRRQACPAARPACRRSAGACECAA